MTIEVEETSRLTEADERRHRACEERKIFELSNSQMVCLIFNKIRNVP